MADKEFAKLVAVAEAALDQARREPKYRVVLKSEDGYAYAVRQQVRSEGEPRPSEVALPREPA